MNFLPMLALAAAAAAPIPTTNATLTGSRLADPALLAALRGTELGSRLGAVDLLADRRDPATIPFLAALALREDEPAVLRGAAAAALGATGHPIAGRYLIAMLSDASIQVRCAAAESLAGIRGPEVVEALQRAAMTDPSREARAAAAQALGALGTPVAASALEVVTTDTDDAVRLVTERGLALTPLRDPRAHALPDER